MSFIVVLNPLKIKWWLILFSLIHEAWSVLSVHLHDEPTPCNPQYGPLLENPIETNGPELGCS